MTRPPNDPNELEPLTPREAQQMYLQDRQGELAKQTLQSHEYRIERFLEWCEDEEITNMNNVGGRDIQQFKLDRSEDVNVTTLKSNLDTVRVWTRFCEDISAVRDGVSESIRSPTLNGSKKTQDIIRETKATEILAHLSKYEYATIEHVCFRLLWETGMRAGALRGIDRDDVHLDEEYIEVQHRPDTGTPLKNKSKGERAIAISTRTCNILRDYIDDRRRDKTGEHGSREPLLTTRKGRPTVNTIRTYTYRVTRPCMHGRDCPHDREPDDCEAVESRMTASKCPDSVGTHALRRGAITHYLNSDVPAEIVSDRLNVQKRTLSDVYDYRDERDKMELRRDHLPL